MFKVLKNLNKKDYLIIILCFIFIVLQVYLDLRVPEYMSTITKLIEMSNTKIISIIKEGIGMLICTFLSLLSMILVGYLTSYLSSDFSYNIRKKIFKKVNDFGISEIKKFKTSSLITRTTNDVTQIEMFLSMGLQLLIKSPIMAIWAISKIINKSISWSILTLICVIILLATVITLFIIVFPKFERVQKLIDKVNNTIEENLIGIRVVRAFNAEDFTLNKFDKINDTLTDTQTFIGKSFAILSPMMNFVMHGLTIGIYIIGAVIINKALLSEKITLFSDMVVFSSYGMQVIASFLMLAVVFMLTPRANVSIKRIMEILDSDISIKDNKNKKSKEIGTIEFKNVSFKHPDSNEYLLKDISFKVSSGETIAFIGSTGSGKSTLINLIPRFYDVTDGEVLVDGVNIRDYKLSELRKKIGYISQKAIMFNGSVKYNVTFGSDKKIDTKRLRDALKVSEAMGFVNKMDKKEDSIISSGGTNISGGQKQRLSIARAIYKNPEIYIFDDSFSALDYKTDLKIREGLKKYTKNATNLIVAQRIGTIINADKIVVLDNGICVGIGTHKTLLKNNKVYKEIAYSQLSKEELENA